MLPYILIYRIHDSRIAGVNRGKHGQFWGKHRVKQIRSFGSFFAVKCTNRLSANQAVNSAIAVIYSLILVFIYLEYYSSIAACAAATRAMGTRKGEQLT